MNRLNFIFSALPIVKIQKDRINWGGESLPLQGSNGVAFNLAVGCIYSANSKLTIRAIAGAPLFTRKVRTDGLTRLVNSVIGIEYKL